MLIARQRARTSIDDRAGQQLRIPQGVRNAVRRQWVLEVAGVADERPSGTMRLPHVSWNAGEAAQAADPAGAGDIRAQLLGIRLKHLQERALDAAAETLR